MRVLIAGGGVAAIEVALALRAHAGDRVEIELLAPESRFWYRPLAVAEPFELGRVQSFELDELAAEMGASYSSGALTAVHATHKVVSTAAGDSIAYDALVIACGAVATTAVAGAVTFRGPADVDELRQLLEAIRAGEVRRLAFVVPWGASWSLPLYELALMTSTYVNEHGLEEVELALVTSEEEPLQLFGRAGSEAIRKLLGEANIELHTGVFAVEFLSGDLRLIPEGHIGAERVVALPRLRGPRIDGVPQTVEGFIPVDAHGRVHGLGDVFAAGDITSFPVKQGGIATQQADAVAESIAHEGGAELAPQPFRPVLRGLLLTGRQPRYLRHEPASGAGDSSLVSTEPLWWPPAKIVGRYLAPFLSGMAGVESPAEAAAPGAVSIEVELERDMIGLQPEVGVDDEADGATAAQAMSRDFLVAAPEDTLGEIAESMRAHDFGLALICDQGPLIGTLSSRDLIRAFAGRVHPSEARAREWMTAEPVTVAPTTPIEAAVTLMGEYGLDQVPVVENERPVGLLGLPQATRHVRLQTGIGLGF